MLIKYSILIISSILVSIHISKTNKQMQNYLDYRYQNQSAQNAYDVPNYMPTTNLYG